MYIERPTQLSGRRDLYWLRQHRVIWSFSRRFSSLPLGPVCLSVIVHWKSYWIAPLSSFVDVRPSLWSWTRWWSKASSSSYERLPVSVRPSLWSRALRHTVESRGLGTPTPRLHCIYRLDGPIDTLPQVSGTVFITIGVEGVLPSHKASRSHVVVTLRRWFAPLLRLGLT